MLWYSLEVPRRSASNEYPQHMFSSRNKNNISNFRMKKAPYLLLCFIHFSALWRQENVLQQELAATREELSKKEQALRSMTGKVGISIYYNFSSVFTPIHFRSKICEY